MSDNLPVKIDEMPAPASPEHASDVVVAMVNRATAKLEEARTIQETKQVVDTVHVLEIYAKRQKASEEAVNKTYALKIYAMSILGVQIRRIELQDDFRQVLSKQSVGSNSRKITVRKPRLQHEETKPMIQRFILRYMAEWPMTKKSRKLFAHCGHSHKTTEVAQRCGKRLGYSIVRVVPIARPGKHWL